MKTCKPRTVLFIVGSMAIVCELTLLTSISMGFKWPIILVDAAGFLGNVGVAALWLMMAKIRAGGPNGF